MELGNGPEQWLLCCMPQFTVAYFSFSNANDYKNLILSSGRLCILGCCLYSGMQTGVLVEGRVITVT
jgi:hypothetical protein